METMTYHNPVLLRESVDGLAIKPNGIYVDLTFGGGGHSRAILEKLGTDGKLFSFDQDDDASANAIDDPRWTFVKANFRYISRFLRVHGVREVDGILGDLGVSSHQFDQAERGFSTRFDGSLDMRMDQNHSITAADIVNTYEAEAIAFLLKEYGELKQARGMAAVIVQSRKTKPIYSSEDLKKVLQKFLPSHKSAKILAQIYQAFRIEVNQEMEALKECLTQSEKLLKSGGRMSIISYHSLEDRLVKRFFRNGLFEGEPERDFYGRFEVPFKSVEKLIIPTDEEIAQNNRARSAKLRIVEKL